MDLPNTVAPKNPPRPRAPLLALLAWLVLASSVSAAERPAAVVRLEQAPDFGKTLYTLDVQRGKATLIQTPFAVSRVAVGDADIADFVAISDREIEVLAKEAGDTNLLIWGKGRVQAVIDVHVGGIQPHIARELSELLDNPSIQVDVAGGSIILRGSVPDLTAYENAGRIARAYLSQGKDVIDDQDVLRGQTEVINLIEVGGGHQVMIEVVIAELRRNITRALGVNMAGKVFEGDSQAATFQTLLRNLAATSGGGGLEPLGPSQISESITLLGTFFSNENLDLRLFLEAVETKQLGTILAEPTLLARSGEQATFLVGGEAPIPVINDRESGFAQFTVLYKPFGVSVDFTPTVLSEDKIHLRVVPEVSEPDFALGVRILGSEIPAFQTRRVNTSVELGSGESFVLAGLLREDIVADLEELPFISDVPLLGQLFKSREFQKKQTELVIVVTPRLVHPLEAGTKVPLPTDVYIEPTRKEFYWDGKIEGAMRPEGSRSAARAEPARTDSTPIQLDATHLSATRSELPDWAGAVTDPACCDLADAVPEAPLWELPGGAPEIGGFIGPYGHRLRPPRPLGVTER